MKIYISGPISHMHGGNEKNFREMARNLARFGIVTIVPHDLFNEEETATFTQKQFLQRCIAHMAECDAIVTLDDWQHSEGATVEVDIARRLQIEVVYYIKLESWLRKNGILNQVNQ